MRLSESDGWSYIPFNSNKNLSFYSGIIENGYLTLAWIAVVDIISDKELNQHHVKREKNETIGITNSLPRLIIATDGKQWYISKLGDKQFKSVNFSSVLVSICDELSEMSLLIKDRNTYETLHRKLSNSIAFLKKEIQSFGENIIEDKGQSITEILRHTQQRQTRIKKDLMPYISNVSKEQQLDGYSKMLHEILFRNLNRLQIQFMLKFLGNDVYASPFYKKGQLLIFITKHFFKDEHEALKHNPTLLTVDKYAGTKPCQLTKDKIDNEIIPNFLKIDFYLVKEFLQEEPF